MNDEWKIPDDDILEEYWRIDYWPEGWADWAQGERDRGVWPTWRYANYIRPFAPEDAIRLEQERTIVDSDTQEGAK
jgi:hypothetical protein